MRPKLCDAILGIAKPVSDATVETLLQLLREDGAASYFGEDVTVTEHQLQAAQRAELEGASDTLIAAALVHDIGWILAASAGGESWEPHEQLGADWLSGFLPAAVTEPVRMHVLAKRYLCSTRPEYYGELSEVSRQTLVNQGGLLTDREVREFEDLAHSGDAVRLRIWDDLAKVPGYETPDLDHYAPLLSELSAG